MEHKNNAKAKYLKIFIPPLFPTAFPVSFRSQQTKPQRTKQYVASEVDICFTRARCSLRNFLTWERCSISQVSVVVTAEKASY